MTAPGDGASFDQVSTAALRRHARAQPRSAEGIEDMAGALVGMRPPTMIRIADAPAGRAE